MRLGNRTNLPSAAPLQLSNNVVWGFWLVALRLHLLIPVSRSQSEQKRAPAAPEIP
jgi:hypothetical protein